MSEQDVQRLQLLYDFKLFIREGLFYDFSDNLMFDFANYMDNLYFISERKYNELLLNVLNQKNILFSPSECDLISDKHLKDIKAFVESYIDKYHFKKLSKDNINKVNVVLYDFKTAIECKQLIYLSDFYFFAYYMKGFYSKYPYYEIANLLCSMCKKNNNIIDNDFYGNFFNSECINLNELRSGHFMEVLNFTREKNILSLPNRVKTKIFEL